MAYFLPHIDPYLWTRILNLAGHLEYQFRLTYISKKISLVSNPNPRTAERVCMGIKRRALSLKLTCYCRRHFQRQCSWWHHRQEDKTHGGADYSLPHKYVFWNPEGPPTEPPTDPNRYNIIYINIYMFTYYISNIIYIILYIQSALSISLRPFW